MIKLYSPVDESELCFIRSVLEAENIDFLVANDNYGVIKPGPGTGMFNEKVICVSGHHYDRAREILSETLKSNGAGSGINASSKINILEKIRGLFRF